MKTIPTIRKEECVSALQALQCVAMEHHVTAVLVGGAGQNTYERLGERFPRVRTVCINTNSEHLRSSSADLKLQIGKGLTFGSDCLFPEVGERCAERCRQEIIEALEGADLVFIIAGLGGGTGSGVAPYVAALARELGKHAIGIVIMPFLYEGTARRAVAEAALSAMRESTILTIAVENDSVLSKARHPESLSFHEGMVMVDEVVLSVLRRICELVTQPYREEVQRIMESAQDFASLEPRMNHVDVPRDAALAAEMDAGEEEVNPETHM